MKKFYKNSKTLKILHFLNTRKKKKKIENDNVAKKSRAQHMYYTERNREVDVPCGNIT